MKPRSVAGAFLLTVHAVVFLMVLTYFVVTHIVGDTPDDANIGLGLSELLMQVLGVPWSLFLEGNVSAVYLIGCAVLNLALHAGWQFSRK